jgi:Flp pilus assembly protein CpaB
VRAVRLRRFTRSPIAFWIGVAVLAIITWSVVAGIVGQAQAEADRFGSVRSAVVAVRAVAVGEVVRPDDVASRKVPAAFLPEGWLGAPGDAVGRTVVAPLFPGQAVVKGQVAPFGLGGVAALLPPGTRAVGVPTGAATAPLRKGDVVDVLATFDTSAAGSQEPTFPVATNAIVVDVGTDAATIAVSPEEAKRVAFAVTQGTVTLAVGAPGDLSPAQRTPVATSASTPRPTIAR